MRVRAILAGVLCAALLSGCLSTDSGGGSGGYCTSQYQVVADAPTLTELEDELAHDVFPDGRSVRLQSVEDGKRTTDILHRKGRPLMQLHVWKREDGSWTGQQWHQCID